MMFDGQLSMFISRPECGDHNIYDSYRSVINFCDSFVQTMVDNALEVISNMGTIIYDDYTGKCMRQIGQFGNIWPTLGNFTIQSGLNSLIKEMESWNALPLLKDWMFHALFIGLKRRKDSEFYTYEVLWSIPTPAYPEPQVTVSVFFYFITNFKYPPHFPVEVQYKFEGYEFLHRLSMIFRPKWLYDVLDMKTMMFQSFDF